MLNIGLNAPIFGGDRDRPGPCGTDLGDGLPVKLIASHIDLQQVGRAQPGPALAARGQDGRATALWGLGTSADTLDGNGRVDVNHGRLYNLPLLLDLLKFLGLRWPDRTAFEDLHALFSIHGSRASVRRLNLTGNAISLIGKGDFNLDGTDLNLDFYPSWGHIEQSLVQGYFQAHQQEHPDHRNARQGRRQSRPPEVQQEIRAADLRSAAGSAAEDGGLEDLVDCR